MNNSLSKGVLLFAYNTIEVDYLKAAGITAKRVRQFLNLPVTVVTNQESLDKSAVDKTAFENVVVIADTIKKNYLKRMLWLNKGRHKAYDLSPYDDTLLLDVDYVINSKKLLELFEVDRDILIHDKIRYLMTSQLAEQLGTSKFNTLWATVIRFQKTTRARQFFDMLKVVETNYSYYSHIYHFHDYVYRNDYGATIALKTINGQLYQAEDFISWELIHIPDNVKVFHEEDTTYTLERRDIKTNKLEYIKVTDLDFHLMDKNNFMELFDA